MPKTLYLIDGHALIFKMYYALLGHSMTNAEGKDTSILYGFTKYLLELIEHKSPDYLAVALDPPGGTFRNTLYPLYKANRDATPQPVIEALEPIRDICRSLNIPTLMEMGFEADDVIGTVARKFASADLTVYMVTPDKDYGQLIDEHVIQVRPGKGGGDDEVLDIEGVCSKYGISSPSQMIDILTLWGDTADNVPGVKGIGEKTAAKLLLRYGSMEAIYEHLGELSPKQRENFTEAKDHIALSKTLVTIKTDVPVDVDLESMAVDRNYGQDAADLFAWLNFNSLMHYLGDIKPSRPTSRKDPWKDITITEEPSPEKFTATASSSGKVSVMMRGGGTEDGPFAPIGALAMCCRKAEGDFVICCAAPSLFGEILRDKSIAKCGYSLKNLLERLHFMGIALEGSLEDISLMHYILDPEKKHSIGTLSASLLGMDVEADSAPDNEEEPSLFGPQPDDTVLTEGDRRELVATILLDEVLLGMLDKEEGCLSLYRDMEEPLLRVLATMEMDGVKVDTSVLRSFAQDLRTDMQRREQGIREKAGNPTLNVSSPRQVGELLFDQLKLDPKATRSPKTNQYSTDEATLQAIAHKDPIVDEILQFRAEKKLLSTYIDPFPQYVSSRTGRVHTTFNQDLTATGRLSSSNPNLQNIPIRTEMGREIRKAFVPGTPEGFILSADYSQIELRVMAHLSCDAHLIKAFMDGVDVHSATAAKIFKVSPSEVTSEQRRIAKTANFGIIYGISSFGLSQRLNISNREAKTLIEDYFKAFPAVQAFIQDTKAAARENLYVQTILGRRRYLPDINSRNATARQLAERNAVNAPIQGTAADIIKLAMIRVAARLKTEGLRSRMVLQIHDELLFDALPDEIEALRALVVEEMENVFPLTVPLSVECNYGKNWLEAH